MRTYSYEGLSGGAPIAFEIDNAYVGLRAIHKLLTSIEDVTEVRPRRLFSKWDTVHIRFKFKGRDYFVVEPFGDNSRYWIGPESEDHHAGIEEIRRAFADYKPNFLRKLVADIISLRFITYFFRRGDQ